MSKKNPLLVDSPSTADTAKQAQLTKRLAKLDRKMDNAAQAKKRERLLREKTSVQQELATLVASSGASSAQVISAIGGARGIDLTLSGAKEVNVSGKLYNKVANRLSKAARVPHPELMPSLSAAAKQFIADCFASLHGAEVIDYHTHIIGGGSCCDTGCFFPEAQNIGQASFQFLLQRTSGVSDPARADEQYLNQLLSLVDPRQKHVLLAFDAFVRSDGSEDLKHTGMMVPNDRILDITSKHSDKFVAACSVHPYRTDALQRLEAAHRSGARLIKWLPNAMGINPASPQCDAYYAKCHELGMVIISHAGEEKAVSSDPEFQLMGNPLLFARALDAGVKVIIAHCASLGHCQDLDSPLSPPPKVAAIDLFLRMMRVKKWEGLLFGDISAITLVNRFHTFPKLLAARDLHSRLVNGSDYPLVCVRAINWTAPLRREGLISKQQCRVLKEIQTVNPLLWDFCLKRCMRGPNGEAFPDSVFIRNPALGV